MRGGHALLSFVLNSCDCRCSGGSSSRSRLFTLSCHLLRYPERLLELLLLPQVLLLFSSRLVQLGVARTGGPRLSRGAQAQLAAATGRLAAGSRRGGRARGVRKSCRLRRQRRRRVAHVLFLTAKELLRKPLAEHLRKSLAEMLGKGCVAAGRPPNALERQSQSDDVVDFWWDWFDAWRGKSILLGKEKEEILEDGDKTGAVPRFLLRRA